MNEYFEMETMNQTIDRQTLRDTVLGFFAFMVVVVLAPQANAQGGSRSDFIDSIPVDGTWQNVTANEGNNLRIDYKATAYSGGGTANGRTVVFGGGHNDGLTDAVAFLDWRNFETVGWVEDFPSTADHIGVADDEWGAIGRHLNSNYNSSTPGGIQDSRGAVALSRHTYDQMVVRDDHFYLFGGVLPFDNPGQPNAVWRTPDEGDIWRYDFGAGWTYVSRDIKRGYPGHGAAAYDSLTGDIWVHDDDGLRRFDTSSENLGSAGDVLTSQAIESSLGFNPEKGPQGTLFGSGTYAGSNWHEYDIATGQQRNMGRVPGSAANTYIIYVDSSYGLNYGTYFALVPSDGTLRRWNGSGWDTIATGAPSQNNYVYGRAGFEPVHEVFYWIDNTWSGNSSWRTHVVRPYPFDGSTTPAPTVSLTADPMTVPEQGSTTLEWSSTNATSCVASGDWSSSKSLAGSEFISPIDRDMSFSLTCSGAGGTKADSVSVVVQLPQPAPTVNVNANPASINSGEYTTVDWDATNSGSCSALGDWSGSKSTQGSESIGPLTGDAQFTIECTGPGGQVTDSVAVTVSAAPPPPPPPPPPGGDDSSAGSDSGGGGFGLWSLIFLLCVGMRRAVRNMRPART